MEVLASSALLASQSPLLLLGGDTSPLPLPLILDLVVGGLNADPPSFFRHSLSGDDPAIHSCWLGRVEQGLQCDGRPAVDLFRQKVLMARSLFSLTSVRNLFYFWNDSSIKKTER